MSEQTLYKVVFAGQLKSGVSESAAKSSLARVFKTAESQVERIFSGKPVTLKSKVSHEEADRFARLCNDKVGLICQVEAISFSASDQTTDDHKLPSSEKNTPSPEVPQDGQSHIGKQKKDTQEVICPFCEKTQTDYPTQRTQICTECGEVIEKPEQSNDQDKLINKLLGDTDLNLVPTQDKKLETIECPECGYKERVPEGEHSGKCAQCHFDIAAYNRKQDVLAEKERLRSVYANQAKQKQRQEEEAEEQRRREKMRAELIEEIKAEYGIVDRKPSLLGSLLAPKLSLANGLILFLLAGGIGFAVSSFNSEGNIAEAGNKKQQAKPSFTPEEAVKLVNNITPGQSVMRAAKDADSAVVETLKMDTVDTLLEKGDFASAEQLSDQFDEPTKKLSANYKMAQAYAESGQTEKAQQQFAKAQALQSSLNKETDQVKGHVIAGSTWQSMGDSERGKDAFNKAVDTSRKINDPVDRVDSMGYTAANLKVNQEPIKESTDSEQLFDEVLDIATNIKDTEQRLQALIRHGRHLWNAGKITQAQKIFTQVRDGAKEMEEKDSRDRVLNVLAKEQLNLQAHGEALQTIAIIDNPQMHDHRILDAIRYFLRKSKYEAANKLLIQTEQSKTQIEGRALIAEYQARADRVVIAKENFDQAKRQALAHTQLYQQANSLSIVAKHQANGGLLEAAKATFGQASRYIDQIKNPVRRRDALSTLADNQSKAGFFSQSLATADRIDDLETSAKVYRTVASRQDELQTMENLGRIRTADTGDEELYFMGL